jgi:hypothetical protein
MGRVRAALTSFAAGILSPLLDGRVDLDVYRKGARALTNWIPHPLGAVQNRSGSKFIARTKNDGQARLIPLVLGQDEEYAIEVGNEYMRFLKDGAQIASPLDFVTAGRLVSNANGYILSSEDAEDWTERPTESNSTSEGIAWSPTLGLFCAVGSQILISPNGIDWTAQSVASNTGFNAVAWSPELGLFCAVGNLTGGDDTEIFTSDDGVTWTERSAPKDKTLNGIVWSPELSLFCAVGPSDGSDAYILTSADGVTWTERSNPSNVGLNEVAWSSSLELFCAVGNTGGGDAYIITSDDGVTWTERSNPKNIPLQGITFGNSLFVAVGNADGVDAHIITSPDGITWTERANPKNFRLEAVAWSTDNSVFCAVGLTDGSDAYMITSSDAITWEEQENPADSNLFAIVSRGTSTPLELVSPYLTAELFDIAFEQKENILYLVQENHPVQQLTRLSETSFALDEFIMFQEPLADFSVSPAAQITINAVDTGINNLGEITADATVFKSGDIGKRIKAGSGEATIRFLIGDGAATGTSLLVDVESTFDAASYASGDWELVGGGTFELDPSAAGTVRGFIDLENKTAVNIIGNLIDTSGDGWSLSGSGTNEYRLRITNPFYTAVEPGASDILEKGVDMFKTTGALGSLQPGQWGFGDNDALGFNTIYVRLTDEVDPDTYQAVSGNPSRRHWLLLKDATVTPIVTAAGSSVLASEVGGFVQIQDGLVEIVANVTTRKYRTRVLKGLSSADATTLWALKGKAYTAENGYPGAITIHEDRLYLAGSDKYPLTLFGSEVGDYDNFIPGTNDSNPVSFTLNAKESSKIVWLISRDILIAGTEGGEWQVGLRGSITTPSNIYARKQTPHGSDIRYPIVAQSNILFVERGNRKLRELTFAFENDSYRAPDRLLLAEHLAVELIKQLTYQPRNNSIVWGMLEDGTLIGMAYEPAFEVFAWFTLDTGMDSFGVYDGLDEIESVTVIADSNGVKELWAVVERVVDAGTIRAIEVYKNLFDSDTASNARMLDSYVIDTSLSTTVTGLTHLIGDTVTFIIDGDSTKIGTAVVDSDGEIDISGTGTPATNVVVGIPYTSTLQTMRIEAGGQRGTSQGKLKRIWEVIIRLYRSMGGKVGTTGTVANLESIKNVDTLTSDDRNAKNAQGSGTDAIVTVVQDQPLPMTITMMQPEVDENER